MKPVIPYHGDRRSDPTGFRAKARKHQSEFREEVMEVDCEDPYGSVIPDKEGREGANFYPGYGILEAVRKRYTDFRQPLYCHTLRSEHIPFNFFIPLLKHKELLKSLLNRFLQDRITDILELKIEYAPSPFTNYLNDRTSFDCYIMYQHIDGTKGIIGIEVKYTEHSYKAAGKELREVNDPSGIYCRVSRNRDLYKENSLLLLRQDKYRQIWRNHLLGERILEVDAHHYSHFTLITLYPSGNVYMHQACTEYKELLKEEVKEKFLPITFESFLEKLSPLVTDEQLTHWVYYLKLRYIVPE